MVKRIGRRFVSLLLTFVTILTMLPAMTLPALAATSGTVTGLADQNIGLSFNGTADNAWSASSTQIIGKARSTSGSGCGGGSNYRSTLTIKNNKTTEATLSFDYTVVVSDGTILVNYTTTTADGSFSQKLAAGGTVEVEIKSGSTSADTMITMTNVKLVADVSATVTFQPAVNGSYTVDGKTITEVYTNTQSAANSYQVVATPNEGYKFLGWYDVINERCISTDAKTALNFDSNRTITARFASKTAALFETGGQVFDDLNKAIAEAQKNLPAIITLAESGKITGNYTIPSKVTLLIPFDEAKTCYTSTPIAITSTPTAKPFRTLTMAAGSSLTLASGAVISIGGQYYAASGGASGKMVGPYGYIKMESGSAIDVQSGASLYAWGFISGSGSVTVQSGGSVYEWYQILDFRGGSASSDMGNKVFPFSQYAVQNVEVPLTLHAGASETVYTAVYAIRKINPTSIPFIGDKGMFKLVSGSLTKAYDGATDRIHYTIDGVAEVNSLNLKLAGASVSSSSYVLPFTNNMTVDLTSGSKLTVNQTAALLPSVSVTIEKNAELVVPKNQSMYIYDVDEWGPYCVNNKKFVSVPYSPSPNRYVRKETDLVDAKIDVNGTLTAAGSVYTTTSGANICSSEGTGKYVQEGNPGKEPTTYQYTQKGSNVTLCNIPITAAKLKNKDGSYTETKDAKTKDTFTYCKGQECGGGKWVPDLKVAAIDAAEYDTLQGAVTKFLQDSSSSNTYIKMLHSTTEKITTGNVTTNKDLYLDLNGCTVTGDISVTGNHKLYGMDSATDTYDGAKAGKIVGNVKGTIAPVFETTLKPTKEYDSLRYVAIKNEDGTEYTFHRFNISVTGYRFELAAPECALFFIGKFQGDDAAKKYLTSLGFTLKGENDKPLGEANYEFTAGTVFPNMPADGVESDSKVVCSGDAYLFEAYLMRSFNKNDTAAYRTKISATAQATFDNGGKQDSEPKQWSFEEAWKNPGELNTAQQEILKKFLDELGIKQ